MYRLSTPMSLFAAAFLIATCDKTAPPTSNAQSQAPFKLETVTVLVTASDGGQVAFPNGTSIVFPPGAVTQDTEIKFSRLEDSAYDANTLLSAVKLEPSGLLLQKPATLTLTYANAPDEGVDALLLVSVSANNAPQVVGGEVSGYEVVPAVIDAETRTVQGSITHFSWFTLFPMPTLHLALELPGKMLRSGDILYSLTGGVGYTDATSFPMHVAIFVQDAGNDTVVESTLPDHDCTPNYFQGVGKHGYLGQEVGGNKGKNGFLTLCGGHVFMGARRPPGEIPDEVGQKAAGAALGKLGKPYGICTLNTPGWGQGTFYSPITIGTGVSCVELPEDAWEEAGVNISLIPDELLGPHDQFVRTIAVMHVKARSSEEVRIPIIGVSRRSWSAKYDTGKLASASGSRTPMELKVTGEPDLFADGRASIQATQSPQALADLVFTPDKSEIGQTLQFNFDLASPTEGKALRQPVKLFVEVEKGDEAPDCASVYGAVQAVDYVNVSYIGHGTATAGTRTIAIDGDATFGGLVGNSLSLTMHMSTTNWEEPPGVGEGYCDVYDISLAAFAPDKSTSLAMPPSPGGVCWFRCPKPNDSTSIVTDEPTSGTLTFKPNSDCKSLDITLSATGPTCKYDYTFKGQYKQY